MQRDYLPDKPRAQSVSRVQKKVNCQRSEEIKGLKLSLLTFREHLRKMKERRRDGILIDIVVTPNEKKIKG